MKEVVAGAVRLMLRLVVVAMGLVLFLSLFIAVMGLALAWALRAGWAKLTGRPVTPWVMRVDPRNGFGAAFRSTRRWSAESNATASAEPPPEPSAMRRGGVLPGAAEVTDVQPREVREP